MVMLSIAIAIFVVVNISGLPAGDMQDSQGINDELGNIIDYVDDVTIGAAQEMLVMPSTYDA